jgi:pilus assembly protein CpaB
MKTKKIWLWAFVFGLVATAALYQSIFSKQKEETVAPAPPENKLENIEQKKLQEDVEMKEQDKKDDKDQGNKEGDSDRTSPPFLPISKGKRAMTIGVDVVQGVSGYITSGSFVDLVYINRPPEEAKEQHEAATLLLQNIKVLAVGHAADSEEVKAKYQVVTLEVTTDEALALGFAKKGELYLLLRESNDKKIEPARTHLHEDQQHKGVFSK